LGDPLRRLEHALAGAERELRAAEVYAMFVANRLQLARMGHVREAARLDRIPPGALPSAEAAAVALTGRLRGLLALLEPELVRNADVFADFARRRADAAFAAS
jgi:hypothetical protein